MQVAAVAGLQHLELALLLLVAVIEVAELVLGFVTGLALVRPGCSVAGNLLES